MVAQKEGCAVGDIKDVMIWGNHSSTQYPDTHFASVKGQPLANRDFYNGEFLPAV